MSTQIKGSNAGITVAPIEEDSPFCRPPATDAQIEAVEKKYGYAMPEELAKWYRQYHAIEVTPRGYRYRYNPLDLKVIELGLDLDDHMITDPRDRFRYTYLLDETAKGLNFFDSNWRRADYLTEGHFEIGASSLGTLVMDFRPGETHGWVYHLILHGAEDIVDQGMEVPLAFVAKSFDAFLDGFFDLDAEIQERIKTL